MDHYFAFITPDHLLKAKYVTIRKEEEEKKKLWPKCHTWKSRRRNSGDGGVETYAGQVAVLKLVITISIEIKELVGM